MYTISKFDIFRIKYSNGEVETFNNKLQSKQAVSTDLERNLWDIINNSSEQSAKKEFEIGDYVCFKEYKTDIIIKAVVTGLSNGTWVSIDYKTSKDKLKSRNISKAEIFKCN